MKRVKRSIIWQLPDQDFIELVKKSKTMSSLLSFFGLANKGGNYKTCRDRIKELNLDTSHFLGRNDSSNFHRKITKETFLSRLTAGSNHSRNHLKTNIIKFNIIEYKCYQCNNVGFWQGRHLSLQLDHINGISDDNRVENLRFLCPNCHSQTSNFAGKNITKRKYICSECNNIVDNVYWKNRCSVCKDKIKNEILLKSRKCERPSKEELTQLILSIPLMEIGKKYNVSDNAVRAWASGYKIETKSISLYSHKK